MASGNCIASPLFFTSAAAIQDLPMLPPPLVVLQHESHLSSVAPFTSASDSS